MKKKNESISAAVASCLDRRPCCFPSANSLIGVFSGAGETPRFASYSIIETDDVT